MNNVENDAAAVRKLFTETSNEYAGLFGSRKTGKNFIFRKRLALASSAAEGRTGMVLDCATGSGEIITAIMATGKFDRATLVDLSPKMLDLTARQIKKLSAGNDAAGVDLVCEDVFQFARQNTQRQFDLIVCLGLIAHTGRLPELMLLLRGLLSSQGVILLQSSLLDHPGTRIERFFSKERYFRKHGYRINYFRQREIEAAVSGAGLTIASSGRYALGIPFGDRLWSWGNYHLERIFQRWADAHGAEVVYLLKVDDAA